MELIVVIAILGLLITISSYAIINIMEGRRSDMAEEMRSNLADAALTYGVSKIFLDKCTPGFQITETVKSDPTNPSSSCFKSIKVSDLISNGYFQDEEERCKRDSLVYIYNYVETAGGAGEYRAFVDKDICN